MFLRLLVVFSVVFGATFLESLSRAQIVPLLSSTQSDWAESRSSPPTRTQVLARQEPSQLPTGLTIYPSPNFNGPGVNYTSESNTSIALPTNGSFQLLASFWAALVSGNDITILWNSCLDVSALPTNGSRNLTITEIQSSFCQPACSGSGGFCSASSASSSSPCTCYPGFNGTSCEICADGHFGPTCQPCPSNCSNCDQGISGTGLCLGGSALTNSTTSSTNNSTSCPPGYVLDKNGTSCDCNVAEGFFVDSNGGCQACQGGCSQCASGSGNCIFCKEGFTMDSTACNALPAVRRNGTKCPPYSYVTSDGSSCLPCSGECDACTGPSSNDCLTCANYQPMFNTSCVNTTGDGICEGSNGLIANNLKKRCDSCGAVTPGCAECKIQDYNVASTIKDAICTMCLPGLSLSEGKCIQSSTCLSDSCLVCTGGLVASSGKCLSTCPSGTFASNNITCVPCHSDCQSCQGSSFDHCTSCPLDLPVPSNGRCLPTCGNPTQFFDTTTLTCQSCDSSCVSCSGSQPNQCLACPWPFFLLEGVCVPMPTLGPQ